MDTLNAVIFDCRTKLQRTKQQLDQIRAKKIQFHKIVITYLFQWQQQLQLRRMQQAELVHQ